MAAENKEPLKPISSQEVAREEWADVPGFAVRYRHLSRAVMGDNYRVGVALEELAPGMQSSPAHYHIFEEEHLYLLEGRLTVRIGAHRYEMTAGDYVCFPASQKAGHCLINNSDATCRYVIVGENNPNEVSIYTDTQKVLVRALGRRAIVDLNARRGYWDGEKTGLRQEDLPPAASIDVESNAPVKPPICTRDVPWEETLEGTKFGGRAKHFTYAAVGEGYNVGMLIESPAPGMRLAPSHYHKLEEEHALILEGQVTLFLGDERFEMKAGDYVCFPAGQKTGHSFMNAGPDPCSYLMIGERNANDVCVYPDSNKVEVRALNSEHSYFDMSAVRRYWDGEQTS